MKKRKPPELDYSLRDLGKIFFVGIASMYVVYTLLYGYALWHIIPAVIVSAVVGFFMTEVAARLCPPTGAKRSD